MAPATEEEMRRISPEPYDMLFDAAKKTLLDLNCEIVNADKLCNKAGKRHFGIV